MTIARRQLVTRDLREVLGAVQVAKDCERIGDLAKNIVWRATMIDRRMRPLHTTVRLHQMSNVAEEVLIDILDAYARRDATRARTRLDGGLDFSRSP